MKVLVIENPGFGQDIKALIESAHGNHEIRVLSTVDLGDEYLRYLPRETLGLDLGLWREPRFDRGRERWASRARHTVRRVFRVFPFDAVIAPADDTPYFRDVIDAIYELGAPYVMLMKEVLRPPYQFETWGPAILKEFPVKASHVLVNSEMNRKYVRLTGGEPEKTWVTGQPRFDRYRNGQPAARLFGKNGGRPAVLFLSYEIDVYMPLQARQKISRELAERVRRFEAVAGDPESLNFPEARTWGELRVQTLRTLGQHVRDGHISLVVKPHPQMFPVDRELDERVLRSICGESPWLRLEPPTTDTRELICAADIVVGFQTTALLESLAAGKPTIYTFWSRSASDYLPGLMPYHSMEPFFMVARNPGELDALMKRAASLRQECDPTACDALVEHWIGRIDGKAGERVWQRVESAVAEFQSVRCTDLRRRVQAGSPWALSGEMVGAAVRGAFWRVCGGFCLEKRLIHRARREAQWMRACARALTRKKTGAGEPILLPIPAAWRRWVCRSLGVGPG